MKTSLSTYLATARAGSRADQEQEGEACKGTPWAFRLVFGAMNKGVFFFPNHEARFKLPSGVEVVLRVRGASETLDKADRFDFTARGFATKEEALACGDRLRKCLDVADLIQRLRLHISYKDEGPPDPKDVDQHPENFTDGVTAAIDGLWAFKDDGSLFEIAASGSITYRPKKPEYIFDAISALWKIAPRFHDPSIEPAVELLRSADRDESPRSRFLLTYAALQSLMPEEVRPAETLAVLAGVVEFVKVSGLSNTEKGRLLNAVALLKYTSPLERIERMLKQCPVQPLNGVPAQEVLKRCYALRNKLSHTNSAEVPADLAELEQGLRLCVLTFIWHMRGLPGIEVPGTEMVWQMEGFQLSVL